MKSHANRPRCAPQLLVRGLSGRAQRGILIYGNLRLPCALGRSGRRVGKREGDGATPIGRFALRQAYYRADRLQRPRTGLPISPLRADDGWCDAPYDRNYNRKVRHPYLASAERLWRADRLYDLLVVAGYNDRPRVRGRGSAIFMHVAAPGLKPTEGCVALRQADLLRLISALAPRTILGVLP